MKKIVSLCTVILMFSFTFLSAQSDDDGCTPLTPGYVGILGTCYLITVEFPPGTPVSVGKACIVDPEATEVNCINLLKVE